MTDVNMFAQIRGALRQYFPQPQVDVQPMLAEGGEQYMVEAIPPMTSVVALGNSWQAISASQAAVAAIPTTTSGYSLNNFELAGGKSYVIESFGCFQAVIDATQIDSTIILAMMNKKGSAQASSGTLSALIQSLSGKGSYGGAAILRQGATVVNDNWFPHGQLFAPTSPTLAGMIFQANDVPVRGMYIVPPSGTFSITAVKSAAAAASQMFYFIRWHELQLNLG